ncbi:hypothetical protein C2845_PM13G17930 [Panicum miliaceum]|uniref:Gypsy-type retrotransposon n=1 Tax=Panicum miliaceum TaxID=4540 RepID=A0A3L6RJF4_PANMI|nr:hypothetical protein C2845_PM13G17930 [Panicum miliaceum]
MAGEVPAAAATAAAAPPAAELAWSPSTMMDANIKVLMAQAYPNKDTPDVVDGATFSLRQGGKYPEAIFKDNNKRWAEEWFMVANLAPGLPPRTGLPPVLNARWEEKPTEEEMVEVEVLLAELQKLKAEKLTGATVALSFAKRLTQPIQERVHPGYEYSGCEDPTRGQNRKVSRSEAHKRVTLIVSGEIHNKGCPKAYCLKRPTAEKKVVSFWCPAPLPEGQQGSRARQKRRPTRKMAASKAQRGGVAPRGTSQGETDAAAEKAGLTTPKPEEEDQEEERGRPARSPSLVMQSLPSAVPLKPSFSVRRADWRASLSGAKCKAEESNHGASSAEVAKEEVSPAERPLARPHIIEGAAAKVKEEAAALEPPQGDDVVPLEIALGDGAKAGVIEDPADPNTVPRVFAPALPAV